MKTWIIFLALCSEALASPPPKLIGYYPEWGIYQRKYPVSAIPAGSLDVVNYAFAAISSGGEVSLADAAAARRNLPQLVQLKASHPGLLTMISVGGWSLSGPFSGVARGDASRQRFAASCVSFILRYGFDGVDVDWEYPRRPQDRANFTLLLSEIRRQLQARGKRDGRRYYLSAALPADSHGLEVKKVAALLDWVNLMSYDLRGPWEKRTGHHAGLFHNPADPEPTSVDRVVRAYLTAGAPASKIMMGIPTYGRAWKNASGLFGVAQAAPDGEPAYRDLLKRPAAQWPRHWDGAAQAAWMSGPSGTLVSYEDTRSLDHKLEYLRQHGLGGMMLWDLSMDSNDSHSLLRHLRASLGRR